MLILSPSRVAAALRSESLSPEAKLRLMLAWVVVASLFGSRPLVGARSWTEFVLAVLYVAAMIVGIRRCFRANQAGDGRAFIERYICLGVPIAIWVYGSYAAVAYASAAIFRPPSTGDVATYPLALGAALTLLGFVALAIYFIVLQ